MNELDLADSFLVSARITARILANIATSGIHNEPIGDEVVESAAKAVLALYQENAVLTAERDVLAATVAGLRGNLEAAKQDAAEWELEEATLESDLERSRAVARECQSTKEQCEALRRLAEKHKAQCAEMMTLLEEEQGRRLYVTRALEERIQHLNKCIPSVN